MEGLFSVLKDLQQVIQKALVNFKKSPKDRLTLEFIEAKLELLESDWSTFKDTKLRILGTCKAEDMSQEVVDVYDLTEESYISCKSLMKSKLNKIRAVEHSVASTSGMSKLSSSFVKLPKITIPTFSGEYSEWTTFFDLFSSLVHKNDSLDNVQKMHYLKSHLTGEAEQLIRHTPVAGDNYMKCWELLQKRYGNKKYLTNCILKRLFSQKRLSTESATSLKELLDTTNDCLNALKNLNIDVSTWDVIIIHIVTFKLDTETRKQWEMSIANDSSNELPTFSQFCMFVERRFRALESIEPSKTSRSAYNNSSQSHNTRVMIATQSHGIQCEYCSEEHKLCFCKQFAKQTIDIRREFVAKNKLCFNCLGANHVVYNCNKITSCRICKRRHHSLLHPGGESEAKGPDNILNSPIYSNESSNDDPIVACLSTGKPSESKQILLSTALIKVESKSGDFQTLRALIDQGSQACFITEASVQFLRLKKIPVRGAISGLGGEKSSVIKHMVHLTIRSKVDFDFQLEVNAYVLNIITSYLPERSIQPNRVEWMELNDLCLADPYFGTPNKIDILLGADAQCRIIKEGLLRSPYGTLIAQNTTLGWILSGAVSTENKYDSSNSVHCHHVTNSNLDQADDNDLLRQFWEIESVIPENRLSSVDEQQCEDLFAQTTYRDEEGRYVVNLPFRNKNPKCQYGGSRKLALKRFYSLENKFKRNPNLRDQYSEVFHEYIRLGHMKPVHVDDYNKPTAVYLAHHAVVREDKTTTKVRIVFDGSMKGLNGVSLNDDLLVGPMLQPPLRHIIMRWRMYPISLCADIIKMYRQVRVAPEHTDFQRVLWRDDENSEVTEYKLVRVTFGTAAAPYLAVKSLQQLAVHEGENTPEIAEIIQKEFYVDDLMTGCYSVEEGLQIKEKITEILTKGGFELQKWVSSSNELNSQITESVVMTFNQQRNINLDTVMKILGISWDRASDQFKYFVQLTPQQTPITKRRVISEISRLFDPLGWMAPCIITSKIFIQKLWLSGLSWDDELTPELLSEWETYRTNLADIHKFSIPRWVNTRANDLLLELHGFCDASIAAYAAVVYLRVIDSDQNIHVGLVTSRTKVAPVRQQSIPRLELMGAVLLSSLLTEVAEVMKIPKSQLHAWTDSSVVLAWLSKHPSHWTTFVGNRVSTILSCFDNSHWAHVESAQNPADIASRGTTPENLVSNTLWKQGPPWLHNVTIHYTRPKSIATKTEQRTIRSHLLTETQEDTLWTKFSNLQRLVRVIAYCRRVLKWKKQVDKTTRYENYLTKEEIQEATKICIRHSQTQEFREEMIDLIKNKAVKARSKLKALSPFIDEEGILRVSGRVQNANLDEGVKHPIILPSNNHFTNLVIDEAHKRTLHGGPTLMLSHLRTKYWIIAAKTRVRAHVRKCVKCKRYSSSFQTPFMAQLPSSRVTPARPFLHTGVDFTGPINIRTSKGRGHQSYKGYICLFVCMATKAVHLEVISDLTAQGFIAGFKRFIARRGKVSDIWSDNGTNFVGASKELKHLVAAEKSSVAVEIREWIGNNNITWHFIPPHSPNFGGLWEAGIKSTKFHLKRLIGNSTLTFEEMSTLLAQIEACLNSRPLSVTSDDSTPIPLTPGHFLIGEPLLTVPDCSYENVNVSSLRRWQFTQRMLQDFWRRWSDEYLVHLLQRYKWIKCTPEPNIGDVVLVKEDNLPPARWLMGKIMDKHPGSDQITRVVTIKCNGLVIKRPVSKLCVLPIAT